MAKAKEKDAEETEVTTSESEAADKTQADPAAKGKGAKGAKAKDEKPGPKKYIALREGHDGVQLIKEGQTFLFAGKKGSWMKEVGAGKAAEKESEE